MIKKSKTQFEEPKKKRGRPRKIKTNEEVSKQVKPKLTLAEKQEIKLDTQG